MDFVSLGPVALDLGVFQIRWYALAYIAGLLAGWRYMVALAAHRQPQPATRRQIDDLFVWVVLGVIIGGRLGHALFYEPGQYLADPLKILRVWEGGMAFHGGLLGVTVAMILFARAQKISPFTLSDLVSAAVPIGLFFGRLANYNNGELWGRVTEQPWGVIFPGAGDWPRHPSQLYQAALEGVLLFVILRIACTRGALARRGLVTGLFVAGYGVARFIGEFFRFSGPDFVYFGWLTHGQALCLPMMAIGGGFILFALRRPPTPA